MQKQKKVTYLSLVTCGNQFWMHAALFITLRIHRDNVLCIHKFESILAYCPFFPCPIQIHYKATYFVLQLLCPSLGAYLLLEMTHQKTRIVFLRFGEGTCLLMWLEASGVLVTALVVTNGVLQGSIFSPVLLNIFLNDLG